MANDEIKDDMIRVTAVDNRDELIAHLQQDSLNLHELLSKAPTLHEVLARPMVYEDWLKKAQEALNG